VRWPLEQLNQRAALLVAEAPTGERVIYCASCTATLVRALDVVPAAKLQEALAFRDLALQAEATACELASAAGGPSWPVLQALAPNLVARLIARRSDTYR